MTWTRENYTLHYGEPRHAVVCVYLWSEGSRMLCFGQTTRKWIYSTGNPAGNAPNQHASASVTTRYVSAREAVALLRGKLTPGAVDSVPRRLTDKPFRPVLKADDSLCFDATGEAL